MGEESFMMKKIIVTIILSVSLLTGCGSEGDDETTAIVMAREFVEDRLKAPSTADFCGYEDTTAEQQDTGSWVIESCVDAENGFGAKIRTDWYVEVEYDTDDGSWELIDISLE